MEPKGKKYMSNIDTTDIITTPSAIERKLMEKVDFELFTIKLSDFGTDNVPEKLYEYAFKKYIKDNHLEPEISTPQELAMYLLMKRVDETPMPR